MNLTWDIESKRVPVRPGATYEVGDERVPDDGNRYRYRCSCGRRGRWFRNGNDVSEAGDQHLYTAHRIGD